MLQCHKSPKLSIVDTTNKDPSNVVRDVARIIHSEDYNDIALHKKLLNLKEGRRQC